MKRKTNIPKVLTVLSISCICLIFFSCGRKRDNKVKQCKSKINIIKSNIFSISKSQEIQQTYSNLNAKIHKFDVLLNTGKIINNKTGNTTNLSFIANFVTNFSEQELLDQASQIINNADNYIYAAIALSNIYVNCTNETLRNEALLLLAKMCHKVGQTILERKYLKKILNRSEKNYYLRQEVLYKLAECYASSMDNQEAVKYYKDCIKLTKQHFPNNHNEINNIELDMLEVLIYHNPNDALKLLKTFEEKHPNCSIQHKKYAKELLEECYKELKPEKKYYKEILNKIIKAPTTLEIKNYIKNYKVKYPSSPYNEKLKKIYILSLKHKKAIEEKSD